MQIKDEPRIVICLSTYNGARFLRKQLDSFLDQDYGHWRLLVHDDGSTDQTIEILRDYAERDSRIRILPVGQRLGIKRGFLTSLTYEDADYYAFSDQDDIWHTDKLTKLLAVFATRSATKPLLAYSDFQEIDATDADITDYTRAFPFTTHFSDLLIANTVTGCTCMINRALRDSLVMRLDEIDYDAMHMHDWWAAVVAASLGEVLFTAERLVSYRQHENNVLGAPGQSSFIAQVRRLVRLGDRGQISHIVSQARMLNQLYGPMMPVKNRELAGRLSQLFEGWHPVRQFNFLKKNELLVAAHSKVMVGELALMLILPTRIRRSVLK